jgi:cytochrome c-type biogenesis protein CcmH/NrfG
VKKNKPVPQPETVVKSDVQTAHKGVSRQNVILIAAVSLVVGFILGTTIAILKMNKQAKESVSAGQSQKEKDVDPEQDIRLAKAILEKDPRNLEAWITLGNAYFDTDRYQEAIEAYSKALAIDPKNPDVRTDLGIMYRRVGQFDQAVEAFRQAARENPIHVNSRFNLGVVLKYDKKDFKGAIQAWEEFLKLEPILDPDDERPIMVRQEIASMKTSLGN